jgi:DNA-binding transcriptional MerR regulator
MIPDTQLPDKLYFKIGEVSEIAGLPTYVLRFWESEFPGIRPKRTDAGQRLYRRADVELILTVKHLLHERKFTIQGARQHLRSRQGDPMAAEWQEEFRRIRDSLEEIRSLLQ